MTTSDHRALIHEIATTHGVALDRDDPILIVQSAVAHVVEESLTRAQARTAEVLAEHHGQLELTAAKTREDLKAAAGQFTRELAASSRRSVEQALCTATSAAIDRQRRVLASHEATVARHTMLSSAAAAVAVLAAATAIVAAAAL